MSNFNLCAVVAASTMKEVEDQIHKCKNLTKYIEVRSDYLNNQSDIDLALIKKSTKQKIIITCRRSDEGGRWSGSEIDRINILKLAFELGFFVDMELRTLEEGTFKLNSNMSKHAIISFHDFTKTPSLTELEKVLIRMQKYNPLIKKIATMVRNDEDRRVLLQLLLNKKTKEKLCVIGMGGGGKIIRITSPLLGGEMTYCTIGIHGKTASGQISCSEMKEVYKLLS